MEGYDGYRVTEGIKNDHYRVMELVEGCNHYRFIMSMTCSYENILTFVKAGKNRVLDVLINGKYERIKTI